MARIKVEEIVDHLSSEFRRALAETVREHIPNAEFEEYALYRTFRRKIDAKCNVWETVPDQYVDKG